MTQRLTTDSELAVRIAERRGIPFYCISRFGIDLTDDGINLIEVNTRFAAGHLVSHLARAGFAE